MNRLQATTFLLLMVLAALAPEAQAATNVSSESSGGDCYGYYHQTVLQVLTLGNGVGAGDVEVWSQQPGCGAARSPTQVLQWVGRAVGPVAIGTAAVTPTWTFSGVSGCTISTPVVITDNLAAVLGTSATATVTM